MGWKGKVISGGQAGVDRGALDAALEAGLDCGGWVPKGRLAEDGPVPDKYPLQETDSDSYGERTARNVRSADATLILNSGELSGGTLLTETCCLKSRRPCLVLQLDELSPEDCAARVLAFLAEHRPSSLNVAGPRESKAPGIQLRTQAVLRRVFTG